MSSIGERCGEGRGAISTRSIRVMRSTISWMRRPASSARSTFVAASPSSLSNARFARTVVRGLLISWAAAAARSAVARSAEDAREVPLEVVAIPLHRGPQLVGEPRELGGGVFRLPTLVRFVAQLGHHGLGAALLPEQPRVENADEEPDDQEEDVSHQ